MIKKVLMGYFKIFRYISKSLWSKKTKPIYNPLYDLLEVMNGKIDRKSLNEFWNLIDKDKLQLSQHYYLLQQIHIVTLITTKFSILIIHLVE